jgi:hypothetical protein
MPQIQGGSLSSGARPDGSNAATAVAANFVLGAGWGGAATISVVAGSTDVRGTIIITASTTTPAQATASVTHTYAGGAWASTPFLYLECVNDNSLTAAFEFDLTSISTTAAVWQARVLPVDTKIYRVRYLYVA